MQVKLIISFLLLHLSLSLTSQTSEKEFQFRFNLAKHELSHRKMKSALPTLMELYEMDSTNSNINYLIGVCFVEGNIATPKSIEHLKKATKDIIVDYNSDSYTEKNAPVYVYYYLSIAYSQNSLCDSAILARDKFMEIYTYQDPYYPIESEKWILSCQTEPQSVEDDLSFLKKEKEDQLPIQAAQVSAPVSIADLDKEKTATPSKTEVKTPKKSSKVLTRSIEYTTTMPLYGVQVGAFKEIMPVHRFPDLKNVDAFVDKDGWVRYVIGHFSYRSQAESLKEVIIKAGYPDVFIVDVNNEKKYAESVVSIDDISLRSVISGPIEFKVQLGVFQEEIPETIAENYLKVSHIEEHRSNDLTYITSTAYPTYSQAMQAKDQYVKIGVSDAFIVAFNKKKKISLIDALNYTHENPIKNLQ
jgi:hypothetical protein